MTKKEVLEEFLNDNVEKLSYNLYRWRGIVYEVLPYYKTLDRHNWSSFVPYETGGKKYMVREISRPLIKKYYKNVYATKLSKRDD